MRVLPATGQVEEVENMENGPLVELSLTVADENNNVKLQRHATLVPLMIILNESEKVWEILTEKLHL